MAPYRPACSSREAAEALQPMARCGDSSRLPPVCDRSSSWAKALVSNGSASAPLPRRRNLCVRAWVERFLCELEPSANYANLLPPNWAFGSNPPSVGKFLARWAMSLSLLSLSTSPSRYVLPTQEILGWQWLPTNSCDSSRPVHSSWFVPDVCSRKTASRVNSTEAATMDASTTLSSVLGIAQGNISGRWRLTENPFWVTTAGGGKTTAGLWWAGQMMRYVLGSLGHCSHLAMETWRSKLMVYARGAWHEDRSNLIGSPREMIFTVAVHVRRGDACVRWAKRGDGLADGGRPCYGAAEYMATVRALLTRIRQGEGSLSKLANGQVRLLVASDSETAAEELAQLAQLDGMETAYLLGKRGASWGAAAEGANLGKSTEASAKEFIEARNRRRVVDRQAVLGSLLADLELLGHAHSFVGTASSWTSRVLFLTVIGQCGSIPPFSFVDRPLGQLWFA